MKVKITYTLNTDPSGQHLEDMLNWPDVTSLEAIQPLATQYLDNKCGSGQYTLIGFEEA